MEYDFNIDKYLEYARNCNGTGHHHHLYLISIFGQNNEVIECSYEEHVELHRILYELAYNSHSKYLKSISRAYSFIRAWSKGIVKAHDKRRENSIQRYNEELKLVNDDLLGKVFTSKELYSLIKPGRKFSNGNNFYDLLHYDDFYRMHFIHTNRTHYTYLPDSIPLPGNWIDQKFIDKYRYVIDFDKLLTKYVKVSDEDEPLLYRINGYNKYDGIKIEFMKNDRVKVVTEHYIE